MCWLAVGEGSSFDHIFILKGKLGGMIWPLNRHCLNLGVSDNNRAIRGFSIGLDRIRIDISVLVINL